MSEVRGDALLEHGRGGGQPEVHRTRGLEAGCVPGDAGGPSALDLAVLETSSGETADAITHAF